MYTAGWLSFLLAVTLYSSLTSATIFLSQLQAATGFSKPCEDAYNAPIIGCDNSDFPHKCSEQCFIALEQASALINNACAPQQAPLDTILGQFFACNGPEFICTGNFAQQCTNSSSSSSSSTGSLSSSSSSTTTSHRTSTITSSTFKSTTTVSSSSSESTSTLTTSPTLSTVSALTSTSTSSTSPTSPTSSTSFTSSTSTSTPPTSKVFVTTAFNNGVATVLTNQAERTSAAQTNPDAFGGGGSPFEIGPNGNGGENQAKAGADFWLLLSVIFGVALMR